MEQQSPGCPAAPAAAERGVGAVRGLEPGLSRAISQMPPARNRAAGVDRGEGGAKTEVVRQRRVNALDAMTGQSPRMDFSMIRYGAGAEKNRTFGMIATLDGARPVRQF
jgi:hypothetical protein